ncbi:MAG TPA: protein-glutamate O-methyltransferase CheR [Alphaproteobacteria bacterium]|nr:protein-glutamate O-methyltransferase CheR [Alphaproteobacteria bacterium]
MKREEFDFFADLVKRRAGYVYAPDQVYVIESRLSRVAQRNQCGDPGQLVDLVRRAPDSDVARDVVDALTAKDTYFFRHAEAFRCLRESVVPRIQIERTERRSLRVWSAACATGQEAYSVAMVLDQMAIELTGWSIEVVGTDLNRKLIERAAKGLYNRFEVQRGLPVRMLLKFFGEAPDEQWQVTERIRSMITFREANLLQPAADLGSFDLILCRNVLGSFDAGGQAATLDRLAGALNDGGILMLGDGEKIAGLPERFLPFEGHDGIYVRPAAARRVATPEAPAVPESGAPDATQASA